MVFPVGDRTFGFKLRVKIAVKYSIGNQNDIYLFVVSKPPDSDRVADILQSFVNEGIYCRSMQSRINASYLGI